MKGKVYPAGLEKMTNLLIQILTKEISRTYKKGNFAFSAFDFTGTNFVSVEDFINAKITYRLPFNRDELRYLLENETVFKKHERIGIDLFVKNFFPDGSVPDTRSASNSSGDDRSLNRSFGERTTT